MSRFTNPLRLRLSILRAARSLSVVEDILGFINAGKRVMVSHFIVLDAEKAGRFWVAC